ncbi:MAG: Aminomethyltransferase [Elusimicrobia bacterium]|nr:Aminomethyltransferase [Elusimicrobiota bacterium]
MKTPFYDKHIALGGKVVDFFGWELPIQYSTITLEHNAVRNKAGLFDISHMGQVFVWGRGAFDFLQNLTTNDLKKADIGKGIYSHLLNDKGGVIDDIFIYRLESDKFLVIVNASRREFDLAWMNQHRTNFEVKVMEAPFAAAFALQGPNAESIVAKLNPEIARLPRFGINEFEIGDLSVHAARTGYTGEDGFEFFAPAGHLLIVWDQVIAAGKEFGLLPCGLGARDTLRTEVAYPLYGHELDENHTSLEADLGWVVKLDKGNFIGRQALLKQKAGVLPSRLLGFKVESGGVARGGGKILLGGKEVGSVASGTFAPSLGYAIGMAYFPPDTEQDGVKFMIKQGERNLEAVTVKMPFYKPSAVSPAKVKI